MDLSLDKQSHRASAVGERPRRDGHNHPRIPHPLQGYLGLAIPGFGQRPAASLVPLQAKNDGMTTRSPLTADMFLSAVAAFRGPSSAQSPGRILLRMGGNAMTVSRKCLAMTSIPSPFGWHWSVV